MKKILFLCEKMNLGGVEMSMLRLIKELHRKGFDISLVLLYDGGILMTEIPSYVHLHVMDEFNKHEKKEPFYSKYMALVDKKYFKEKIKITSRKIERMLKSIPEIEEKYDLAIDFHGYGSVTLPVLIKKVIAKRKIAFVHDENVTGYYDVYKYMPSIDAFFAVSEGCKRSFLEKYPCFSDKVFSYDNVIDFEEIKSKSNEKFDDLHYFQNNEMTIVSVGRLEEQKGFDRAINISARLVRDGYHFKWLIVGEGTEYHKLKESIRRDNLENTVFLLGARENPFPFIKAADLFAQVSRHEGKPLSVTEALILGTPCLVTHYAAAKEQVENGVNGFVVDNSEEGIEKILRKIMDDPQYLNELNGKTVDIESINKRSLSLLEKYVV